eukprot:TRINITY_DN1747_c0_g1_i1.p1 TRINITY_DN1747_c0_g1~~TRINITY_DN1747_c0_g1_i1.p1  ORF type:complete len:110 (+),score=39.55 TRINITY_DN1747_c0_g1_i1:71-400(+)
MSKIKKSEELIERINRCEKNVFELLDLFELTTEALADYDIEKNENVIDYARDFRKIMDTLKIELNSVVNEIQNPSLQTRNSDENILKFYEHIVEDEYDFKNENNDSMQQ